MIRPATPHDFPAIVALHRAWEQFTSPMDRARLEWLDGLACHHTVFEERGAVVAFLLVFRKGAAYPNPTMEYFASRLDDFLYVDRIVVSTASHGRGIGRRLYQDLFRRAAALGVERITCEVDVDPPNQVSSRFHRRFGFEEATRQPDAKARKTVSLMVAPVPMREAAGP